MTDKQVRDEVVTLLLVGQETTAIAMTWIWFLLSQHPQVEAKLQQELETVLGDRSSDDGSHFIASCDRPLISPHTTTKLSGCVSPLINTPTKLSITDYRPSQI
ncbi:cytochrome [Fischerella thermalis CCMEE 5268]|uniref:Cytochrome n=1 Tax=Fischerella thermalis CCMEE 5268 TaxID=2019662 RepID=A0A2N6KGR0_9CYAN|nr:cytochrome P450 [Fischerella thermalis]PLZ98526.1 cytochrome [Fischerella thermalis CCMEE 5268]